jgi:aconitate hydratase 2/2-methylisocitrate dehydratase
MKTAYLVHIDKRVKDNLPPLVLDAKQTSTVVENLINGKYQIASAQLK